MYLFHLTTILKNSSKKPSNLLMCLLFYSCIANSVLASINNAKPLITYPLCINESYKFTAQAGLANVQWQRDAGAGFVDIAGANGSTYNANLLGKYRYIGKDVNNCDIELCDILELTSSNCNSANYPLCTGESYKLTAQAGLVNIQWQKDDGSGFVNIAGAINTVYNATSIGIYRYIAQDANGCDVTQCDAFELIPATCIGYPLCPSESYKLTAQAGLVNIQWQKDNGSGFVNIAGATNAIYNATTVGKYKYTAKDANDCAIELCTPFEITQGVCNTGSISGKAFTDKNSSGIQDIGDTPLANVIVTLKDNLGNVVTTTTTDATGNYTFGNLAQGTYTVTFPTQSGFIPTDKNVIGSAPTTNSDINNNGSTDPITLNLGQSQNNIDGGFKPSCTEIANISGSTTVCDNNLSLLSASAGASYLWSNGATTADINVGAGTYTVTVTYANSCTSVANKTVVKSTSTTYTICPGESYTLTAQSGLSNVQWQKDSGSGYVDIVGANATTYNATSIGKYKYTATDGVGCAIGLCCAFDIVAGVCNTATIGNYVFEDVNKNGIQDAGDLPLANVSVILKDNLGNVVKSTTSDSNGNYSFTNIAAGTYTVQFVTPVGSSSTVKNAAGSTAANNSDINTNGETDSFVITQGQTQVDIDAGFKTPCVNDATISGNTTVCAGKQTTLTASAGASYLWNNAITTQSITVGAGTYSVTITKADACIASKSITVTEDNSLANFTISASAPQLTCAISSITLTPNPSTGLTYVWSDGSNGSAYTVRNVGTYSVTATNANGCTAVASILIGKDNSTATANIYPKNNQLTCKKTSITLKATGGTTFLWSDGSTSANLVVNTAGTYSVTVTNLNGCTNTASVTVPEDKTAPSVNISATNTELNCNTPTTTLTATGGSTYVWSNGNINPSITVGTGGTYSVTATGTNGCTAVASETITEDKIAPTANITVDNNILTCKNPSATLTATGGVTYSWNNGSGSDEITVTTGGIYTVTLTGDNGCTSVATKIITVDKKKPSVCLDPLTATLTCKNPSITITETCPQTNTFDWSNGDSGQSITVTTPGIYFVTVTGANGCTVVGNTVINEDKTLPNASITPSIPMLNCANPTAILTVSGNGTYVWDNGSTNSDRTVSAMGTYSATVTGANGCTATAVFTMMEDNTQPIVNITPKNGKITCSKKSVTLKATGGVTYVWEDGSANSSLTVTAAGIYTVTATGTNGCTAVASVTVTEDKTTPIANITTSNAVLTCKNPTATLTATGGGTYNWSNGNINPSISVNAVGTYSVTVTSANGCTAVASNTITEDKTIPTANISADYTTLTCKNPSATLTATGGGTYNWSDGSTNASISTTTAGTYTVTVSNTNGCTAIANISIFENKTNPTVSIWPKNGKITCSKTSVTLNASTGDAYLWSNGATTKSTSVSAAGTYTITVTSINGCTAVSSVTVTEDKTVPTATATTDNSVLTCKNSSAILTATGGGTYNWSNNTTGSSISVVVAGTYTVTVTGTNGCTAVASVTITEDKAVLPISITTTNTVLTCKNPSSVLSTGSGNSYMWSTGSNTPNIIVTTPGTYYVTATNSNGCSILSSVVITEDKTPPTASITPSNAVLTCKKPSATLTATGGGTYNWSNNTTSSSISATAAGTYTVTVTGANGCTAVASATVTEDKNTPTADIKIQNNGSKPGTSILTCAQPTTTLVASGGGTYLWSNGSSNATQLISVAGTYTVTVSNPNGCTATSSITVTQDKVAPIAKITSTTTVLTCTNSNIVLNASGGGTYLWSNNATTNNIEVTAAGTYSVTVTGKNGCTSTTRIVITENKAVPKQCVQPLTATLTCNQPFITVVGIGGGTYKWSNGATTSGILVSTPGTYYVTVTTPNGCTTVGKSVISEDKVKPTASVTPNSGQITCNNKSVNLTASGSGTYNWGNNITSPNFTVFQAGTYIVTVTGANGCTSTASAVVTQNTTAPTVTITPSNPVLPCDGSTVTLTATGGTLYNWSNGQSGASITTKKEGTYTVTVTNANGCKTVKSVVVSAQNCNTAKIGDCVFEDTNGNGIQDLTEKGVPNITVSLLGNVNQTTVTDANGKYLFSNLPAGNYTVKFSIPSVYKVTLKDKGNDDTKDSDIDADGLTQQYTLTTGQSNLTIDAGIYKPSCIGDFVFIDKNRNGVQDAEEFGLSGVTVQLFGTLTDGSNIVLVTTTNATGYYKFPFLAVGTYYIKINSPAGYVLTAANVGLDDAKDSDIDPITGKSETIALGSNQQYLDLDAGVYNKFDNVCANDVTKPVFQTVPNNITVECKTTVPQSFTVTATDNCTTPANITISYVDVAVNGICPVKQIITRTWTAKDQAGNTAQVTGTITTIDTKAPVITGVPANITVVCGVNLPTTPTGIKATDDCDGDVSATLKFSEKFYAGPCISNGTTSGKSLVECTWTAKDACGNIATKTWTITVIDGTSSKVIKNNNNEVLNQSIKEVIQEEKINKELNTILEARAYPNPSNGIFTVDFGSYDVRKLIIFDMAGIEIYNETFTTKQDKVDMSLTNQRAGMYSIFMQTTQGIVTKRIFIVN